MTLSAGIVKKAFAFLHLFKAEDSGISFIKRHRADVGAKFNGFYTPDRKLKGKEYSRDSKQDESLHSWFSFENLAHSFWMLNTAPTQSLRILYLRGTQPTIYQGKKTSV
jgi:hypothetical protein